MSTRTDASLWRVVAASVAGSSHEKRQRPCQDACHWATPWADMLVAAVADGAGSAPLGNVGATIATRAAVESVRLGETTVGPASEDGVLRTLLLDAFNAGLKAIEAEAAARGAPAHSLATTLILAMATPAFVAVAQIGDGAAVTADREGNLAALTVPQRGEYANETVFLTSQGALDAVQVAVWRGAAAHLALFSDGVQMLALKLADNTPHEPFFTPLFRFVADATDVPEAEARLTAFLRSPRVRGRTDDDLTLLLASLIG